jgi:serine/threonine protein kinase
VTIAGRYRLVRRVGAGGMGVVWEAWDERLHRTVAVKQLHAQLGLADDEAHLANERAMREARITARLDHPNAVPVFDVVEHNGQPCLIMQFLPSEPLSAVLKGRGKLPFDEVARIGGQVASALAAAHRLGIVHRDVKPGNVLIAEDGTARISDFGISHALGDVTLTSTGMVHGTPAYLAPEVARGAESSFSSDVFGLGATLYAAVEGAPPFGANQNSIALLYKVASGEFDPPDPDGPLTPLLTQMLAPDPADRPAMGDVAYALARSPEVPPVPPPARDITTRVQPTVPRNTPWTTAAPTTSNLPTAPYPVTPASSAPSTARPSTARPSTAPAPSTPPLPAAPVVGATATASAPSSPPPATPAPGYGASPASGAGAAPAGRRRSRLAAALVALVVLVAVAAVLINQAPWRDAGVSAAPGNVTSTPSASTSAAEPSPAASASPSESAESTPSPRASRSASSSPSPTRRSESATPSPSRSSSSSAPPAGSATAAQLRDAVTAYYAQMPGDTDAGWERLTASYQREQTGSKANYERFWGAIDRVTVSQAEGSPPDRAEATVTYYLENGRVSRERTSYELVEDDGVLKINGTRVISSSGG